MNTSAIFFAHSPFRTKDIVLPFRFDAGLFQILFKRIEIVRKIGNFLWHDAQCDISALERIF